MGRLRPDEALATAHHRRPEGPEMRAKPESSRGAFLPYSISYPSMAAPFLKVKVIYLLFKMSRSSRGVTINGSFGKCLMFPVTR